MDDTVEIILIAFQERITATERRIKALRQSGELELCADLTELRKRLELEMKRVERTFGKRNKAKTA